MAQQVRSRPDELRPGRRMGRRAMMRGAVAALLAAVLPLGAALADGIELLMFERPGCPWCAQWNAEIAPIYDRTTEGRAAPLRRVQLADPLPEGVVIARPVVFTPTFVLVRDGAEQGRIEGYPGQDFFWPLLQRMIAGAEDAAKAGAEDDPATGASDDN